MIILGLVGSVAAGKSTTAKYLSDRGARWVNADSIAKLQLREPEVIDRLVAQWGSEILSQGEIDRSQLATRVFGQSDQSRENLGFLESVIHPRTKIIINERIRSAWFDGVAVVLLDIPLLFKAGWHFVCDEIWCVDSAMNIRQQRCEKRGWPSGELERRESNQLSIVEKRRLSNVVVQNDGTLEQLFQKLDAAWRFSGTMEIEVTTRRKQHCSPE